MKGLVTDLRGEVAKLIHEQERLMERLHQKNLPYLERKNIMQQLEDINVKGQNIHYTLRELEEGISTDYLS